MCVEYPLSLRTLEHLLAERGIDIRRDTVRFWRNSFGPMEADAKAIFSNAVVRKVRYGR